MPAAVASSNAYWISGLSTTGSISLGMAFVTGRKRVPSPATGNTALRTRFAISPSVTAAACGRREYCGSPVQTRIGAFRCLAVQQDVPGPIDLCRKIIGAAMIGVELLHEAAVRVPDLLDGGASREAENGVGLLHGHIRAAAGGRRRTGSRAGDILLPIGVGAVEIGFDQASARLPPAAETASAAGSALRRTGLARSKRR